MDTFRDKLLLDDMYARGVVPWGVRKKAKDITRAGHKDR